MTLTNSDAALVVVNELVRRLQAKGTSHEENLEIFELIRNLFPTWTLTA